MGRWVPELVSPRRSVSLGRPGQSRWWVSRVNLAWGPTTRPETRRTPVT